jgi:hypothetical protein
VTELNQTDEHVEVILAGPVGQSQAVRAEYVVGCDGPRSVIRAQIGSAYEGENALKPNFGMVFRAPSLLGAIPHGRAVHYWVLNPAAPVVMGPLDLDGTWWLIALGVERAEGERHGREIIEAAVGGPVDPVISSTDPWTARMQLVDRARCGRVFLAGDAAHLNPPWGGHGLNTGIGDAVDLGWKLAATLQGWGGRDLLASYEQERRPIHRAVIDAAARNMSVLPTELLEADLDADGPAGDQARQRLSARIQATKDSEFHALDLVLGASYDESPLVLTGGGRLKHARVGNTSIYDLLGPGFSLLEIGPDLDTDPRAVDHTDALDALADWCRSKLFPLSRVDLRHAGLRQHYAASYVLVRPDQHVAWSGDRLGDPVGDLLDLARGEPLSKPRPIDLHLAGALHRD